MGIVLRGGWGYDPYWRRGPGYVVVDRPIDVGRPDIGRPEAMPLPEPMPERGMPDFGGFDIDPFWDQTPISFDPFSR